MRSENITALNFNDSSLPANDLTPERIAEIEKVAMPLLNSVLNELRKEQPELFKVDSDKK